jgi:hypothetical protein
MRFVLCIVFRSPRQARAEGDVLKRGMRPAGHHAAHWAHRCHAAIRVDMDLWHWLLGEPLKRYVAREDRRISLDNTAMQLGAKAMAPRWGRFGSEMMLRRSQCLVSRPHATLALHSTSAQTTQASAHGQKLSQVRKQLDWPVRILVIVAAIRFAL